MDFHHHYTANPSKDEIKHFQTAIIDYYRTRGRNFPWRNNISPYSTLVSEIMLQQTQVYRVEPRFTVWMQKVPDFAALADLSTDKLLGLWQGLGYNRRALALREIAVKITCEYGGNLPEDPEVLVTFPGIGPATAASICAFAFNMPVVFIETNIRRVFIHFFFSDREVPVTDKELLPLAGETLWKESPRDWYNALMDLGTELKSIVPNPNRQSRHYTRQAAFEGSNRQARGAVLKVLQGAPAMNAEALSETTGIEYSRIIKAAGQLASEGFIAAENGLYKVQS